MLRVGLVEVGSGRGSAPGLGILSWTPLIARTLLTLVLNPTGTNHFYCQSILGLCSCGNKSFFQSSLFNLASVCVCVWGGRCAYINALFLTCLACFRLD